MLICVINLNLISVYITWEQIVLFVVFQISESAYCSWSCGLSGRRDPLAKLFKTYGEESHAKKIAAAIVGIPPEVPGRSRRPSNSPPVISCAFTHTAHSRKNKDKLGRQAHVATKTFQGLRIFVNNELNELSTGLETAGEVSQTWRENLPSCRSTRWKIASSRGSSKAERWMREGKASINRDNLPDTSPCRIQKRKVVKN